MLTDFRSVVSEQITQLKDLCRRPDPLLYYLSHFHKLEFRTENARFRCVSNHSINIFRSSSGNWRVHDLGGGELSGTLASLVYQKLEGSSNPVEERNEILILVGGGALYLPERKEWSARKKSKSKSQKLELTFDGGGKVYQAVDRYFTKKVGYSLLKVAKGEQPDYGIRAVKSVRGKYSYNFWGDHFAIAYCTDQGTKVKCIKGERKDYLFKDKGKYCFGLKQLGNQPLDMILICEGEDDALCVNLHFNSRNFKVKAVSLGGASYTSPGLVGSIIEDLKTRAKKVWVLYDGDKAGVSASQKLASTYGLGFLDFERNWLPFKSAGKGKEGVKDIADLYQKNVDNPKVDSAILVAHYIASCLAARLSYLAVNKFYKAHRDKWCEEYSRLVRGSNKNVCGWYPLWKLLRERHPEWVDDLTVI